MPILKTHHGVVIPAVTPFTEKRTIDYSAADRIMDFFIKSETFPFILGTTGESSSIMPDLKLDFVKMVTKSVNGRKTLYAGISDNCLENSILTAKKFFDLGVEVFVAHPPYYYPLTEEHLQRYFEMLADKIPAPLILYNIPATTHISLSVKLIKTLSQHPNIMGLKDSERSLERMKLLSQTFCENQDFCLMSGWTVQSHFALSVGFDGIVPSTANIVPSLFQRLYLAAQTGKDNAQTIQNIINPIADIHQKNKILSEVIPALKVMMNEKGLCSCEVMPPLTRSSNEERQRIIKEMNDLQIDLYM